jgi:hypothetical protein
MIAQAALEGHPENHNLRLKVVVALVPSSRSGNPSQFTRVLEGIEYQVNSVESGHGKERVPQATRGGPQETQCLRD